jgi:hypothetical protein
MTSQMNIAGTMQEHGCDEKTLLKNPEWLMQHYVEFGGAKWAEDNLRPRFYKQVEVPLQIYLVQVIRQKTDKIFGYKRMNKVRELREKVGLLLTHLSTGAQQIFH